ncbi:MAG: DNA-3-methyladenine glycosylase [Bacteroides sp. SM23_62]|nr:MAG: DNA-3-methyladenine glycosylase [Bacteroides sp. SM23_62]
MKLAQDFFRRDALEVAPDLLGKILVRRFDNEHFFTSQITEVEAYRGEEDKACHASKGRTSRTEIMYHPGGSVYVYLIYGMYWMLNFVTGDRNEPQAVLIRGLKDIKGPGRITRRLEIGSDFYGEDLAGSERIWIEDNGQQVTVQAGPRIGIAYAGEPWNTLPWRFVALR